MKAQDSLFHGLLFLGIFISLIACKKDEEIVPPGEIINEPGISADAFESYDGEIGILINAREAARKGYKPVEAVINVAATSGNFSQTIALDEYSFMGRLKIPVEDLNEAAKEELISGIPVNVTLRDKDGKDILASVSLGAVSFLPNPNPQDINAAGLQETKEIAAINLSEGAGYYLQKVKADGKPLNMSMRWNRHVFYGNVMTVSANETFAGDQPDHVFNFIPAPDEPNTFYIKIAATQQFVISDLVAPPLGTSHYGPKNSSFTSIDQATPNLRDNFRFKIEKVKDGVYRIRNHEGKPVKEASGIGLTINHPAGEDVYWRIVAKDISWTVQSIATTIITPVLPTAKTGFSFNSTLKNCGAGNLEQTVGVDFSEQRSNTIGWSESISINNTSSQSVSSTVEVEFDAKFFGVGSTYNASLTTGFEWSQSVTKETSTHGSETITKTETYFSARTITVPSGKASLVYDAYQYYENVRVDYVQRFRLSGLDKDGTALSGDEIKSLFQFTRFNGVINAIEENSVVFTLRGYTVLDKFIETQSSVEDTAAECN